MVHPGWRYLIDEDALDRPDDDTVRERMAAAADVIRSVITGTLREQDLADASPAPDQTEESKFEEDKSGDLKPLL